MSSYRQCLRGSLAVAALLAAAACAQHGGALLPVAPQAVAVPDLKPPACKGQQTFKHYATLTGTLSPQGGSFCIPAFGGFGGKLKYPDLNPSIQLTLSTSTENFDNFPQLGSGTPLFYLAFSTSGGTTFGSDLKKGGGLAGKQIVPGQPYTAYGQVTIYGYKVSLGPCYTTARKSKYGGAIGALGALIKGQQIPFKVNGVIEIYSGEQTGTQC